MLVISMSLLISICLDNSALMSALSLNHTMKLSPIVLFAFNRPHHTYQTIKALSNCKNCKDSTLIVSIDGYSD